MAADGIHSALQSHVVPPSKPVFHGTISYRGLVARERLPGWPMDRWLMWAGPSKHFLVFPVRHGTMVNYVGFVPTDEEMKESWSAPGDPAVLRRAFEGWDPRIGQVLAQVDKTFRWALYDREPLPTWSRGRLTLLGDAAHPMLPHLGQGANQSIEDGMALATILSQVDASAVPAALLAYERLRRERVAEIQRGARQNGLRVDSAVADLKVRDAELAAHAEFRKQLYAYDVVPAARAAAASCRSSALRAAAASLDKAGLPGQVARRAGARRAFRRLAARASRSSAAMPSGASFAAMAGALTACSTAPTSALRASSGMPAGARKLNQMPKSSSG